MMIKEILETSDLIDKELKSNIYPYLETKKLSDLLNVLSEYIYTVIYDGKLQNVQFKDIEYHSALVKKEDVFFAVKGENYDGNLFIGQALQRGASAIIVSRKFYEIAQGVDISDDLLFYSDYQDVVGVKSNVLFYRELWSEILNSSKPIIVVENIVCALCFASKFTYDDPSSYLDIIGVTGTNGKTSITNILKASVDDSLLIGSIGYKGISFEFNEVMYTTPKALQLNRLLFKHKLDGGKYVFMEVSSHSIPLCRVYGINFKGGVFTNLTRDHMDYHKTMDNYFVSKKRFFTKILKDSSKENKFAIINLVNKNKYVDLLVDFLSYIESIKLVTISQNDIDKMDLTPHVSSVVYKGKIYRTNLIGQHNIINILLSALVLKELGINKTDFTHLSIPGRLEKVHPSYDIYVDYAHTPDALQNVIIALKQVYKDKNLIVVFGAGGNRDKGKRPEMGHVVSSYADYCIITNDNPRGEDPLLIVEGIKAGIKHKNYEVILDRSLAIKKAVFYALNKSYVVLIAGKGAENYQIIDNKKLHFSDKKEVLKYISQFKKGVNNEDKLHQF